MGEEQEKEIVIKRKIWADRKSTDTGARWLLVKAQGFKPDVESWTDKELDLFLRDNPDVEPVLKY